MNVVKTRGKFASVTPKGRGFLCRHPGCGRIEATAELVLEHARDEHGLEGREVVDLRHVRCLWEGCGKLIAVQLTTAGHLKLRDLLNHEALHRQATSAPRGFLCPGAGCDKSFDKSDGAWECGETHGVERDDKRCLYENCGRVFPSRCSYRAHEPTHTNIWTFTCPTCDKGHKSATLADNCHVVGAACVCRWWYPANRCKGEVRTVDGRRGGTCSHARPPLRLRLLPRCIHARIRQTVSPPVASLRVCYMASKPTDAPSTCFHCVRSQPTSPRPWPATSASAREVASPTSAASGRGFPKGSEEEAGRRCSWQAPRAASEVQKKRVPGRCESRVALPDRTGPSPRILRCNVVPDAMLPVSRTRGARVEKRRGGAARFSLLDHRTARENKKKRTEWCEEG
jgi:hypothetical protein